MEATKPVDDAAPETPADVIDASKDGWDPLQSSTKPVHPWTTTNLGEAVPGIMCPLNLAYWDYPGDLTARRVGYAIGVMSKKELEQPPDPAERILRTFYGRLATNLNYMGLIGDRMPGITGEEALSSLFGKPPEGMTFHPTKRRYLFVAYRFPRTFIRVPGMLKQVTSEIDAWWRRMVEEVPNRDLAGAKAAFAESIEMFQLGMDTQVTAMMGSFQPMFDALSKLVESAGVGDLSVLSGSGGAEIAVVTDIWRASRGEITVADIVRNHGFHGPGEGEISSTVWREDPSPLHTVVEHYKKLPESEHPARLDEDRERKRVEMTKEVLAALPRSKRAGARLVMELARRRVPHRGRAKRSFLQAIDVGRLSARRIGDLLVADGRFEDRDDAFYLTHEELTAPTVPPDVRELIRKRRQRRKTYERIAFRSTEWVGMPDAYEVEDAADEPVEGGDVVTGTGVSSGVAEGLVRVVEDPTFADVEPDEILVAPTTDPSWCSIMYVSSALVVDLGGALSHAAVVARELNIPCVVNTRDGTRRLATGDRVRVDGKAGTVEILERA
jgi:phosphohistidine swiveling domain-containing protein